MKKILFVLTLIVSIALTSCGSKSVENQTIGNDIDSINVVNETPQFDSITVNTDTIN